METQDLNKWYTLHVDEPWWNIEDFYNLDYQNVEFNDSDSLLKWKKLGYTQNTFTGDLYGYPNETPEWIKKFYEIFQWENCEWQLYRMLPGRTLPAHSDTYKKYKEVYGIKDSSKIYRAIVFLEDWQSGHYFEIDSNNMGFWKKGDYVVWQNSVRHIAANVGELPRYTLQLTGTSK